MENAIETLLTNREQMYHFLSLLYLEEVDEPMAAAIQNSKLLESSRAPKLAVGCQMMQESVKTGSREWLDILAVDYGAVFLSAGVAQGLAAFPYESAYVKDVKNDLAGLFGRAGIQPKETLFRVPEDHIGLELAFMAHLCKQAKEVVQNADSWADCIRAQRDFLENHLLNWYAGFCGDIEKYAKSSFYLGLSKMTQGFIELERDLMAEAALWEMA